MWGCNLEAGVKEIILPQRKGAMQYCGEKIERTVLRVIDVVFARVYSVEKALRVVYPQCAVLPTLVTKTA